MVLVILQHSYLSVDRESIPVLFDAFLWNITSLAAIAFVAIAGVVCSYSLYSQTGLKFPYGRFIPRAAFLILLVHPAINLTNCFFRFGRIDSSIYSLSFPGQLLFDFPITDTIGLCLLLSPFFIVRLGDVPRTIGIVAMLFVSLLARVLVAPENHLLQILKEGIFGVVGLPEIFWFPIVPWLAIFLTGTFLGKSYRNIERDTNDISALIHRMKKTAIGLTALSLALLCAYKLLKVLVYPQGSAIILSLIAPDRTSTLLPGCLAILLWILSVFEQRISLSGRFSRLAWCLSVFGRTSLFTYVVQFVVVESIPALFGLKGVLGFRGFLTLFFAGLVVMWFLSYFYGRLRGWLEPKDFTILSALACRTARPAL